MKLSISIILPLYNEEENVKQVFTSVYKFFSKDRYNFEIILVNDGSIDNTESIINGFAETHKNVRCLHHPRNLGYSRALVNGFNEAKGQNILFMDADGQFDIKETNKFLPFINKYEIISGIRVNRQDPWFRIVIGKTYTLIINFLFGLSSKDMNAGFKLIKKTFLEKISLVSNGPLLNAEILFHARSMGLSVKEIPITHLPRCKGKQSGASIRTILMGVIELVHLFFQQTNRIQNLEPEIPSIE